MLIVHNEPVKPLRVTVIVPPKGSQHPMEVHVDLATALARLEQLPKGTRYASVKVQGDVLAAIRPSNWKDSSTL